eukprot:TRINITY_DN13314_c0_g1_i1.p1 TRINITY_DN13314_c0_g1~~TRINITY_DN13314_c0_g1_i1.p1  ORF type:complete len:137 (-),score=12.06 TRINITY_DN13314_c0_g1_i1:5-415(-)
MKSKIHLTSAQQVASQAQIRILAKLFNLSESEYPDDFPVASLAHLQHYMYTLDPDERKERQKNLDLIINTGSTGITSLRLSNTIKRLKNSGNVAHPQLTPEDIKNAKILVNKLWPASSDSTKRMNNDVMALLSVLD